MKNVLTGIFSLMLSSMAFSQTSDLVQIENTIRSFAKAGDEYNIDQLEELLDDNYRVVMNRLFGSQKVDILDRVAYLDKIEKKEFGGDKRTVVIENVVINGTSATAKVTMKGEKLTFYSLLTLVKNEANKWSLISDVPVL